MLSRYVCTFAVVFLSTLAVAHAAPKPAKAKTAKPAAASSTIDLPDLSPEYRARAQQVVADLVADGQTDVDELVDTIATQNYEQLDHIVINISNQTIYECNLAGQVLRCSKVSSGRKGYDTPPGDYTVHTKSPKAYSQKYSAWMLNWMGFTSDGSYGMHGLEGSSYERHLGSIASHGCVRLSRKYAKDLYTRVKVGMPVKIVNDSKLKLDDYKPISREDALSMVLEVLSPTDPQQIFY
jgi:lipoprotein-anchoring transpeptidase ErfK/SrfK